jgi:hypothetical protein
MSAETVLSRLDRVRRIGTGRWIARCPAHADRSPSLSVRELDDGRVLLHDFGGCEVGAVLGALDLEMADLFHERLTGNAGAGGYTPSHSRIPARDLLEILDHEITVASLILADVLASRGVAEDHWSRLALAASRIGRARDHVR